METENEPALPAEGDPPHEVTQLLQRIRAGDPDATQRLTALVYQQLRHLASRLCHDQSVTPTLGPTAIVHEGFLKLVKSGALATAEDRQHLYSLACRAMRQVIIDYARSQHAKKRGGGRQRMELDAVLDYFHAHDWDLLELNEAISELEAEHERKAEVVHLKFFGGLSTQEIADGLGVSCGTVEGDWRFARAYLRSRLASGEA